MIRVKYLNPFVSVLDPGSPKTLQSADQLPDYRTDAAKITVTLYNKPSLESSESNFQTLKCGRGASKRYCRQRGELE